MTILNETNAGSSLGNQKHLRIDAALRKLDVALNNAENLITTLVEGPVPVGESVKEKQPEPPFCSVYTNIAERVEAATERVDSFVGQIRDILL